MNLSKSKYCNGIQCKKMLWLLKYKPEEMGEIDNESVLDNGIEVGNLAKKIFGKYIDIEFNEDLNFMIEDTLSAIKNNENAVITEASFVYENNFCSVDLLKKNGDYFEIYEVKSSTKIKDIYIDDISYQYYVLKNLGLNVTKAKLVYINSEYIRNKELELNKLFNIEDVTDIVREKELEVKKYIEDINKYMEQTNEPNDDIDIKCFNPYNCPFFKYCTKHLPEKNVFNIKMMRNSSKLKLYHQGIYRYEDLLKEKINVNYKEQIEFELYNKKTSIKRDQIKEFLNELSYPLYFLDFETYQEPIPLYDGIKPFMQIPFQYSLHYIEKENGLLKHKEFLGEAQTDPRRSLAEKLIQDIPMNTCILAYNMSFEKSVIKNLANLYEDLKEHLMNIHDNIKDLMPIFKNRYYYTKEMHGSYSIKYVLPALFPNDESLNYHNLELIHNGKEASNNFVNLNKMDKKEQEVIRKNLLKYCELDTYAMVKIWVKLKEVTEEVMNN